MTAVRAERADMAADGNEITITGCSTFKEIGDRIELEWQLSGKPSLEWAEIFEMTAVSDRRGVLEWVKGGSPDVIGAAIRWFVPTSHTDDAGAEVLYRLAVANERCGLTSVQT